jgi:hypothetical protein
MQEILTPSNSDLIREIGLIVIGLIIRFLEKRKAKKSNI